MFMGSGAPATVLGVCMNVVAVVELLVVAVALLALLSSKLFFFTIYTVLIDSGEESAPGRSSTVAAFSRGGLGDLTVLIMSAIFLGILFETNSEIELRFVSWPFWASYCGK